MDCKIRAEKNQPWRWRREGQKFKANLNYKAAEDLGLRDTLSQKHKSLSEIWWYRVMISVVQGQPGHLVRQSKS